MSEQDNQEANSDSPSAAELSPESPPTPRPDESVSIDPAPAQQPADPLPSSTAEEKPHEAEPAPAEPAPVAQPDLQLVESVPPPTSPPAPGPADSPSKVGAQQSSTEPAPEAKPAPERQDQPVLVSEQPEPILPVVVEATNIESELGPPTESQEVVQAPLPVTEAVAASADAPQHESALVVDSIAPATVPTTEAAEPVVQELPLVEVVKQTTLDEPVVVAESPGPSDVEEVKLPAVVPAAVAAADIPITRESGSGEIPLSPIEEVPSSAEHPASEVSNQVEVVSAPTSPASVVMIEPIERHEEVTPLPSPVLSESSLQPILAEVSKNDDIPLQSPNLAVQDSISQPVVAEAVPAPYVAEVSAPVAVQEVSLAQANTAGTPTPDTMIKPILENKALTTPEVANAPSVPVVLPVTEPVLPQSVPQPAATIQASPTAPTPIPAIILTTPEKAPTSPYDDPNLGKPVVEAKVENPISPQEPIQTHNKFRDHFKLRSYFKPHEDRPRKRDRARAKLLSENLLSFSLGKRHAVVVRPLLEDASKRPRKAQRKFNAPEAVSRTRLRLKRHRSNRLAAQKVEEVNGVAG